MSVIRVSILTIPPDHLEQAEHMMIEAESALEGIRALPGLRAYFAGINRTTFQLSNVSVWDSVEHAKAMTTFQPMLDLANAIAIAIPGVTFMRPIPNFETLWQWGEAGGADVTNRQHK
jgi:hypothetical protein